MLRNTKARRFTNWSARAAELKVRHDSLSRERLARATAEVLESRRLLTTPYAYTVLATTGGALGLTTIGTNVSINDSGVVAFQGKTPAGQNIFAGDGSSISVKNINPAFSSTSRSFSALMQSINSNEVVALETVSGGTFSTLVRTWDVATGTPILIQRGSSPLFPGDHFSSVTTPAANNTGDVIYSALKPDLSDNNQYLESSLGGEIKLGTSPITLRPQLADTGVAVFRNGNTNAAPIQTTDKSLSALTDIASTAMGYTALGQEPGISDDGTAIAFYAVDASGPGIFIRVNGTTQRIAGTTGTNAFTSFSADSRVGIQVQKDGTLQVVFLGTSAKDGLLGVYDATLIPDSKSSTGFAISSDRSIVEVGETPVGTSSPVATLALYDPLNSKGQIAFVASATDGTQEVLRYDPFLYDYSARQSIDPGKITYHEQYDEAVSQSKFGTPGGAACGPSSLSMALQELGISVNDVSTIYDNTTTDSQFYGGKAVDWLASTGFKKLFGTNIGATSTTSDTWSNVDANLAAARPVLLSTLFTSKKITAANNKGSGHVILLLGKGQNAFIRSSLQTMVNPLTSGNYSGDYYIVADPAGNYFADPNSAGIAGVKGITTGHYGKTAELRTHGVGENFAGAFAVYPVELLQYFAKQDSKGKLQTLTIGTGAKLRITLHSPVNVLVADPLGRESGYNSGGTFIDGIPGADYEVAVGDSDEDSYVPPADPEKYLTIDAPVAGNYTITLTGTGTGSYTLDSVATSDSGQVTASDEKIGTTSPGATAKFTFAVPAASTGLTAIDDTATVSENSANNPINILANDTDSSGTIDVTSVAIGTAPANGTATVNPTTGIVSYTPKANYAGADVFTYTVKDSSNATSNIAKVTITVAGAPPVAVDDTATGLENNTTAINVLSNDTDSGGTIAQTTVAIGTGPAHGKTAVDPSTGVVAYTPNAGYLGSDSFTYTVKDQAAQTSNVATVKLNVVGPTAPDQSISTLLNTPVIVKIAGLVSDTASSTIDYTSVVASKPAHGTVGIDPVTGAMTYTPATGFLGTDSFTYTVKDSLGATSSPATIHVSVRPAFSTTSHGTDFWVGFGQNYTVSPQLSLFITSQVDTTGTVTIPGLSFVQNFTVAANTTTTVTLPSNAQIVGSAVTANLGIHVTSADEVSVYGISHVQFTSDGFLGLPTPLLGTQYEVMGYTTDIGSAGSDFEVLATQDNTTVTVTPTTAADGHAAGVPYNISLNQGQIYQSIAFTTGADLTGTQISSTKPVAVYGGNSLANVPNTAVAGNILIEEMPPTNTWGKHFVTEPLATRKSGDTFRVLASVDNTSVTINGTLVTTLNKGQFYETILPAASTIDASQAVLLAQFSNGESFDGTTGDPYEMIVPPFEQFLADYTVSTPATDFTPNFVNVVAPATEVGQILLDGTAIPAANFTSIGTSGFSGAQVAVSVGSHHLTGPQAFGVFSYGFAQYDGYGYPGGLSLAPVASVTDMTLAPATATATINKPLKFQATVYDSSHKPLLGIRVDFVVSGTNTAVGFGFTDSTGVATFTYTPTKLGADILTATTGSLTRTSKITVLPATARNGPTDHATDDTYSTPFNTTLSVRAPGILQNDTSSVGAMTPSALTAPLHGKLTLNSDGSFTYIPAANFAGDDSFTYQVFDGVSLSNIGTVRIYVAKKNAGIIVTTRTPTLNIATATALQSVAVGSTGAKSLQLRNFIPSDLYGYTVRDDGALVPDVPA